MSFFGQRFKNDWNTLKQSLTKMKLFEQKSTHWKAQKDLDQALSFYKNPNHIHNEFVLQIMHYILIEYSRQLFLCLLEINPNVRLLNDCEFVSFSLKVSRQILKMDVELSVEKFLQNKFLDKKVQFLSQLARKVIQWQSNPKNLNGFHQVLQKYKSQEVRDQHLIADDSDDSEEAPRCIQAKPISFQPVKNFRDLQQTIPFNNSTNENNHENFDASNRGASNRNKITRIDQKPLILQNRYQQRSEIVQGKPKKPVLANQEDLYSKYMINPALNQIPQGLINNNYQKEQESSSQQSGQEYANKQDFNKLMVYMKEISQTINTMSNKFDKFQHDINKEIKNINAKVMMLENNVKMIKDNI